PISAGGTHAHLPDQVPADQLVDQDGDGGLVQAGQLGDVGSGERALHPQQMKDNPLVEGFHEKLVCRGCIGAHAATSERVIAPTYSLGVGLPTVSDRKSTRLNS